MRTLILYYSRTGNTRRVAEILAGRLAATPAEITCRAYGGGLGALRQAFGVLLGSSPRIELTAVAAEDWDLVVLGGPVWGARPAPPVRSYLQRYAAHHRRLALFVTCKGTSPTYPPERAMAEMTALAPSGVAATHIFSEAQIAGSGLAAQVDDFLHTIGATG